jgi:hypothetical protein
VPQTYITLTDDTGQNHPISNGPYLITALTAIQAGGRQVGELAIKAHGGPDIIQLAENDPNQSVALIQGHILPDGENVDQLIKDVTAPGRTAVVPPDRRSWTPTPGRAGTSSPKT